MNSPESGPVDEITTGTDKLLLDFPAEAVARLTISDPDKRNALDHDVLDAISSTLPELDRGIEVRCLIITGADPVFSAGYDIGSIPDENFQKDAEALVAHPFPAAMEAIDAFPWPTVAALNGHCLGGGLELAITCDLRICSSDAKLGMPAAKLGLIYGHTGLIRFIETIGAARTREMFFTGGNVGAARAEQINLVNRVVPGDDLQPESVELAARIAANAPLSMKGNKRAIATILANPVLSPEQEAELVELRESCFSSDDLLEGITAFGEKRKPRWSGR
ncbi:MAG: enoyl-CoA hydratase/isomerase family protein [Acidobacteriota bacterium]|jgi:enoyl-CoA hydratase/carnithine racemase